MLVSCPQCGNTVIFAEGSSFMLSGQPETLVQSPLKLRCAGCGHEWTEASDARA